MGPAKKKEKPGGRNPPDDKPELTSSAKELYMTQIRDLERKVTRYQRRLDELEVSRSDMVEKHEQLGKDLHDVIAYLKKCLNQKIDEIADLNDKLIALKQAKDNEKDSYEIQLSHLRQEFQETKDQLASENMILAGKLDALEEFRIQKEELMMRFASLEEQLKHQEKEHNEIIYDLERRAVVDKHRLKKELVSRVNVVAAEFRRISKKQVAETTKRAIRENASISNKLGKISDKSIKVIKENDDLKSEAKKQQRTIHILEDNQKELAKKNFSNLKVIQMLTEKCKQQQESLENCMQREKAIPQLETSIKKLEEQNESLRNNVISVQKQLETKQSQLDNQRSLMEQQEKHRKHLERVLSEAAYALKEVLQDKTECADESFSMTNQEKTDSEELLYAQRSQMMQKLLLLLNSAAVLGLGPSLGEFIKDKLPLLEQKLPSPQGSYPSAPGAIKGPGILPHYKVGDLGLVPRPKQMSPSIAEKVGQLSKTTRFGLIRPFAKSAPTEMTCLPKDSPPADQGMQASILPKIAVACCLQDQVCNQTS
ncbi:cilia- and flagella-associated protein 157 isoform X1 [Stegostoma tigrinum]|uniref:cilia- and flagella-associated protein 157 isoform X1 n=1 Tax=Stegostoma tigrinum TaxID=3053191 RepID=UPI00202B61C2|nr:cilia- and flagella-associated protein 157 isoform X1 [Stegostoma tigrinum]